MLNHDAINNRRDISDAFKTLKVFLQLEDEEGSTCDEYRLTEFEAFLACAAIQYLLEREAMPVHYSRRLSRVNDEFNKYIEGKWVALGRPSIPALSIADMFWAAQSLTVVELDAKETKQEDGEL